MYSLSKPYFDFIIPIETEDRGDTPWISYKLFDYSHLWSRRIESEQKLTLSTLVGSSHLWSRRIESKQKLTLSTQYTRWIRIDTIVPGARE